MIDIIIFEDRVARPFIQQVFVHGHLEGDVFPAHEVDIRMLEDSKTKVNR